MLEKNDEVSVNAPVFIKKYANRRLYNTETSTYVTLDGLACMIRDGHDLIVQSAKTGEDITHSVLTQIIFEQESRGNNLLPTRFLRQLICMYDDSARDFVPGYLEMCLETLVREQKKFSHQFTNWSSVSLGTMQEQMRNSMAVFGQTVSSLGSAVVFRNDEEPARNEQEPILSDTVVREELDELRRQMNELQLMLDSLRPR